MKTEKINHLKTIAERGYCQRKTKVACLDCFIYKDCEKLTKKEKKSKAKQELNIINKPLRGQLKFMCMLDDNWN